MAKLTLTDISAGYESTTTINANNTAIETAMENTLSRDGTTPNSMSVHLDMNSNRVTNVSDALSDQDACTLGQLNAAVLDPTSLSIVSTRVASVADSNEAKSSDNTLAAATQLGTLSVDANTWYVVKAYLHVTNGGAGDFQFRFNEEGGVGSATDGKVQTYASNGTQPFTDFVSDITLPVSVTSLTGVDLVEVHATYKTGASTTGLTLYWAQNTSVAGATTLIAGSYIEAETLS